MAQTIAPAEATPPAETPLLLSAPAAARFLGISRSTFFRMRAAGRLPLPVRPLAGGDLKYRRADLERMVNGLATVKRARRSAAGSTD
jgi:predicted DNA-binding transcriptional regulator AlpA